MPKSSRKLSVKLKDFCNEFPGLTTDGSKLYCNYCETSINYDSTHGRSRVVGHVNSQKHETNSKLKKGIQYNNDQI